MSTTSFGAPWILVRKDQPEQAFPLLKMRQLATIQNAILAERSEIGKRLALEQKLPPDQAAKLRALMERDEVNIFAVREWSRTPSGCVRILQESLANGSRKPEDLAPADAVIDGLQFDDAVEAALRVTGWVPPPPEEKTGATPPPDPAAKSSGTATGG
jgi:hypothetical protein